nr:MAG TPA: hypothetical protein [Caudoviricetes sp.]
MTRKRGSYFLPGNRKMATSVAVKTGSFCIRY